MRSGLSLAVGAAILIALAQAAFRRDAAFHRSIQPYSALEKHRHDMARFGQSVKAVEAAAKRLF